MISRYRGRGAGHRIFTDLLVVGFILHGVAALWVLAIILAAWNDEPLSTWVQTIGVPFAVFVAYRAATMQVDAAREQRVKDRAYQEAAHLLHLHELTGWLATSIANTLKRRHAGNTKVESVVLRGLATENLLAIQRLDVMPFSVANVSIELVGARSVAFYVAEYYASESGEGFKPRRFQFALRPLVLLAAAVEERLKGLVDNGAVEPVQVDPVKQWKFAGDWDLYFEKIDAPFRDYVPPDESADVA